jgi:hypothetical protein
MAIVWIADTAAYFTGRAFGRRKLAPQVSPRQDMGRRVRRPRGRRASMRLALVPLAGGSGFKGTSRRSPSILLDRARRSRWPRSLSSAILCESLAEAPGGVKDSGAFFRGTVAV